MSELNDRTATLQPRSGSAPVERSAREDGGEEPETLLPVDDPDRYEQIREHARGGLGRIVRAVDRRLGRTVAVKELLRRDDLHEARFVREALITARLEHPGIVPVHEAGRWPNGDPYYVMKLVEGRTLKELMASTQDSPRERLALLSHVIAVADAVGYAHSEGVVHRDVKPSNVIVGAFGETIVVDWGLARDCKRDIAEPSDEMLAEGSGVSTISGKVVGTPAYMAPEQARGELVDARADVYAIGAVLYELLAGKAPHHDQTPKAMLDRVIAGPPPPLCIIAPAVPTELADIIAKAMARDPSDRYANATLLAEDLRAFQTGKLVSAHAYTPWQLVRKRMQAHRGVVAVALASTIALGAVGVESFRKVVAERDIAQGERGRAESAAQAAENKQRELVLLQAQTSLRKDPTAALAWLKQFSITPDDRDTVVDVIDEAVALGVASHVVRLGDWALDAQFTRDGKSIVECGHDGILRRYDLATHRTSVIGKPPSEPSALAMSPDGTWVVTGSTKGEVVAWPLRPGVGEKPLSKAGKTVSRIDFADDDTLIVHRENRAEILDLDGNLRRIGKPDSAHAAVALHDLTKQVVTSRANEVSAGDRVLAHTDRMIEWLGISPDGQIVFIYDGKTLFRVPFEGGALTQVYAWTGTLDAMVWTRDLKRVALIGKQPEIPILDVATNKIDVLRGHSDAIYDAQFTSDGSMLVSASDDSTARVWDLVDGTSQVLRGHDDDVLHIRLSPDEKQVVTASLDGTFRVWPLDSDDSATAVFREGSKIEQLDPVGDNVIVRTATSTTEWDLEAGTRQPLISWETGLARGRSSPDGQSAIVLMSNNLLELRHRDGRPPVKLAGLKGSVHDALWSANGKLVYGFSTNALMQWDAETGEPKVLIDGDSQIQGIAVSKDGRVVASLDGNTVVMIHPDGHSETLGSGSEWCVQMMVKFEPVHDRLMFTRCDHSLVMVDHGTVTTFATEGATVENVAASPDGRRFAAAMSDRTIRVWDSNGTRAAVLRGHSDLVLDVAFSPDGSELASASYDKTVRIWQLGTNHHRVLRGSSAPLGRILWKKPDQIVTAAYDGTIRVWPVPSVEMPSQKDVSRRLDAATSATIDAQNRAATIGG
ncbi:MAG: protein kinase [Kofleriaceae bacterium]